MNVCFATIKQYYSCRNFRWNSIAHKNHFEIVFNQLEIRLYLPFSDWFGTPNGQRPFSVPNQSENGKYNLILV